MRQATIFEEESMSDLVLGKIEEGVGIITLNRPQASNAMSLALGDAFYEVTREIADNKATRAFLIRSEGKNFCAGGDINDFVGAEHPSEMIGKMARRLHDSLLILHNHRAPVVMAVQGAAAGAGFSMVSGADVAIAGRSASFLWAYAAIGLTCDGGSTWNLPRVIGMRRAQELAFTGRRLTADEAAEIGLVTRVVEDDVLDQEALSVARAIAEGPTASFGEVKKLFAASMRNDYATQLAAEANAIEAALTRSDALNAISAFLERRKPAFTGD
jgi:2-(1,2-epoxy-1,2-dihydrophenyl)acetyl-CoA isomerase